MLKARLAARHGRASRDADTNSDGDCTDCGGSERLFYTQDVNFNVTALVGTDAAVAERYVYSPYGLPTVYDANCANTISWSSGKKNEILYCGYRYDAATGRRLLAIVMPSGPPGRPNAIVRVMTDSVESDRSLGREQRRMLAGYLAIGLAGVWGGYLVASKLLSPSAGSRERSTRSGRMASIMLVSAVPPWLSGSPQSCSMVSQAIS